MDMTLQDKQALQAQLEGGDEVAFVSYDPATLVGDPEGDALAAGWNMWGSYGTPQHPEVIYTRALPSGSWVTPAPAPPPVGFTPPVGGAIVFAGVGQEFSYPGDADWAPGVSDFTIEWYQYQTETSPFPRIFSVGGWPTASIGVSVENTTFYLWLNGAGIFAHPITPLNGWHHYAVTRQNGTAKLWQDGALLTSAAAPANITNTTTGLLFGNEVPGEGIAAFTGKLSNFRWVNGTALYTTPFTNPGALSAVPGCVLLLNTASALSAYQDSSGQGHVAVNSGTTWEAYP